MRGLRRRLWLLVDRRCLLLGLEMDDGPRLVGLLPDLGHPWDSLAGPRRLVGLGRGRLSRLGRLDVGLRLSVGPRLNIWTPPRFISLALTNAVACAPVAPSPIELAGRVLARPP